MYIYLYVYKCSCVSLHHANSSCANFCCGDRVTVLAATVLSAHAAAMFNFFMLTANVLQCQKEKRKEKEKETKRGKLTKLQILPSGVLKKKKQPSIHLRKKSKLLKKKM